MTLHSRREPCPTWCHPCPLLKGAVMPMCLGSVVSASGECDLTGCTCTPADPFVNQTRLVEDAAHLLGLLRDRRRERRVDRADARRLVEIVSVMKGTHPVWREVEAIAKRLATANGEIAPPTLRALPSPEDRQ